MSDDSLRKLTVNFSGKIKSIERNGDNFDIIYEPRSADLWQDRISIWYGKVGSPYSLSYCTLGIKKNASFEMCIKYRNKNKEQINYTENLEREEK